MNKSYILISLALTLIIGFVSCNKNQFAKRKYMPGTHRDHSVKVQKPKSKNDDQFIVENKTINQDSLYVDSDTSYQEVAYLEDINFNEHFDDSLKKKRFINPLDYYKNQRKQQKKNRKERKKKKLREKFVKDSLANDPQHQLKSDKEKKKAEEELSNESEELKKAYKFSIHGMIAAICVILFLGLTFLLGIVAFIFAVLFLILMIVLMAISLANQRKLNGTTEQHGNKANKTKIISVVSMVITILAFFALGLFIFAFVLF